MYSFEVEFIELFFGRLVIWKRLRFVFWYLFRFFFRVLVGSGLRYCLGGGDNFFRRDLGIGKYWVFKLGVGRFSVYILLFFIEF